LVGTQKGGQNTEKIGSNHAQTLVNRTQSLLNFTKHQPGTALKHGVCIDGESKKKKCLFLKKKKQR